MCALSQAELLTVECEDCCGIKAFIINVDHLQWRKLSLRLSHFVVVSINVPMINVAAIVLSLVYNIWAVHQASFDQV